MSGKDGAREVALILLVGRSSSPGLREAEAQRRDRPHPHPAHYAAVCRVPDDSTRYLQAVRVWQRCGLAR